MRSNVSWKRWRVSLSILRIGDSSVASASVRSANCRSRYSLRSDCSLNSSMAARFTDPRRAIRSAVSARFCSQVAIVSFRRQRAEQRCQTRSASPRIVPPADSRRTRISCTSSRALSIAVRISSTRPSDPTRCSSRPRSDSIGGFHGFTCRAQFAFDCEPPLQVPARGSARARPVAWHPPRSRPPAPRAAP